MEPKNPNAVSFLAAVGWSEDDFTAAYGQCFKIMGEKHMSEKERLSELLPQRILAICGLSWNPESKNRNRDFERYASAVAAETALVKLYRKKLLITCAPARALRKDLHDLFLSWTPARAQIVPGQSGLQMRQRWEFADNVSIEEEVGDEQHPDIEESQDFTLMRTEWDASRSTSKASKKRAAKVQKDSIEDMLETLKSSKLLHCADPKVPLGTLESLSAFAISILGHVI